MRMSSGCRSRPSTNCCVRSLRLVSSRSILVQAVFPEVLMTHRYIKPGLTAAVLVAAFAGLLWSTLQDGTEYYKHVDELMSNPAAWNGKRLQLHGFVVSNSILRKPNTMEYRFKVHANGKMVDATYTGIVPDTFKDTPGS